MQHTWAANHGLTGKRLRTVVDDYRMKFRALLTAILIVAPLALGQILIGTQDSSEADIPPEGTPPATHFTSDVVMHADLGTELGSVPNAYANYQIIRSVALHINLDTAIMGFTLGEATTLVYAHPTLNAHATYKPSWLTAANGWTYSGNIGTISMPAALTAAGMQDVAVYYYEKTGVNGAFTFDGWRSANWDEVLGHYVGAFLVPAGVAVTLIEPEIYELIADISAAYAGQIPASDELWWDVTPDPTYDEVSTAVASWAALHTAVEAAACGDFIELDDGTYNNAGLIDFDAVACTKDNWITVRPNTPGGAVLSGTTRPEFSNSIGILWEGFDHNAVDGGNLGSIIRIRNDSEWIVVRNIKIRNIDSVTENQFGVRANGKYVRLHNSESQDITDGRQIWHFETMPASAYPRGDHLDMIDHVLGASSGAAEAATAGNEGGTTTADNGMLDHNRLLRWDKPGESEAFTAKGSGWTLANNLSEDSNGNMSFRRSCDYASFFNRFLNNTNKNNRNRGGTFNGCSEARTDAVHALNVIDYFSDPNGWHEGFRTDSTDTSRRQAKRVLVVGDMVWAGDDQIFRTQVLAAENLVEAENLKFFGLAAKVTSSLFNVAELPLQLDWIWAGSVMDGAGFGTTNPGGITEADPDFQDRGDGILIPQHANIDYDINVCFPGRIEGGAIANLGTTW